MVVQKQAHQVLNDAMLAWDNGLSRDDVEGNPRELVHSAFLAGWKAGREHERELACDEIARLAGEVQQLRGLLTRSLEYLDYMEDRGYSSQRVLASDIRDVVGRD